MNGKVITLLRIANSNMSITELSEKSGVSKSYLVEIEKNKTTPSLKILSKISKTYNIPIHKIQYFSRLCDKLTYHRVLKLILEYYITLENKEK